MPANLTTAVGRVPTHSIFAIALLISLAVPVWSQDYDKGLEAFQAGDFDTALNEWRQLAEQGHARAQYELGNMYEYGRGVGQNDADAVKWYTKSASQGLVLAQYKLGVLYENGWGFQKTKPKQ